MSDTKSDVLNFLNTHRKAVFSIIGTDDHPHASLMLYAVDDSFCFFFGTTKSSQKYSALKERPHISVVVTQGITDPLQVAQVEGEAEEIPSEKTEETIAFFESKNPSKFYVKGAEDFVMFKVVPHSLKWLDATSGKLKKEEIKV